MTKASLKYLLSVVAVIGAIAGVLRAFFVTPVVINDDGMAPTLLAGETVLMWNREGDADFGDVVVCRHPANGGFVVGRYLARPGTAITTDRGFMKIDGHGVDRNIERTMQFTMHGDTQARSVIIGLESRGGEEHPFMQDARGLSMRPTTVRAGIFLVGDNRLPHGFDSRTFGPVDPTTCVGHIFMRWSLAPNRHDFDHNVLDSIP